MPILSIGTWLLLTLAALFSIGLVIQLRSTGKVAAELAFTADFRTKLRDFVTQADPHTYEWLTLHANRMQLQLGSQGLVTFKPPYANHRIQNYPVVINVLPELRRCLTDQPASTNLLGDYASLLDDALVRYLGSLFEVHQHSLAANKNPIVWLASGTRYVLAAPLWFLASAGVLPPKFASRVVASTVYRVLSGSIATIGFVSALVGLVTGWEQFATILRKLVAGAF
jgi:hypothetical protein